MAWPAASLVRGNANEVLFPAGTRTTISEPWMERFFGVIIATERPTGRVLGWLSENSVIYANGGQCTTNE